MLKLPAPGPGAPRVSKGELRMMSSRNTRNAVQFVCKALAVGCLGAWGLASLVVPFGAAFVRSTSGSETLAYSVFVGGMILSLLLPTFVFISLSIGYTLRARCAHFKVTPASSKWKRLGFPTTGFSSPGKAKSAAAQASALPGHLPFVIGFFHPYADDGGGGEKVLWAAVAATQKAYPRAGIVIYTGKPSSGAGPEILKRATARFGVTLPSSGIHFVWLTKRHLVEASTWPVATLAGQALGSMVLTMEALRTLTPDVWIDTMGYAASLPIAAMIGGARVGAYVHYPTISSDMLQAVAERRPSYNNASGVAGSARATFFKLWYYKAFAKIYGWFGSWCDATAVNSNWTGAHIKSLWGGVPAVLFPPCDTEALEQIPLQPRQRIVISIGQFRPEKAHMLQLEAFREFKTRHPEAARGVKLVVIGACRNDGDQERLDALYAALDKLELDLDEDVEFAVNVSYEDRNKWLATASVGLHTMWNEHFGIGIVEMMASGVVPIAHNSGGPKKDIVVRGRPSLPPPGLLASTAEEYADAMAQLLDPAKDKELKDIQQAARNSVGRFSEGSFAAGWIDMLEVIVGLPSAVSGDEEDDDLVVVQGSKKEN